MAKGYWIACVNVKKQDQFKKYVDLAGPAINLHGGKFLVRGGKVLNIEGKQYERIVVSVFDSTEKAEACYKSKEYQQAIRFLKDDVAKRIIHIAEGLD
mgnify:CR=1 FL=1